MYPIGSKHSIDVNCYFGDIDNKYPGALIT